MNSEIALICFSCIPWNFTYHRPHHLMTRFAKHLNVIFVEPSINGPLDATYTKHEPAENITVIRFQLSAAASEEDRVQMKMKMFSQLLNDLGIHQYIFWYYTPEDLNFTSLFSPVVTIYDCMREFPTPDHSMSSFLEKEIRLSEEADIVFTAGPSLFESRKTFNPNTYCMAGSVDIDHFFGARYHHADPSDQAGIPHPRIGFNGIIDERIDMTLLRTVALRKPEWHFILLGPVVGMAEADLPDLPNLHFLGKKNYFELPDYISGWEVAMLPFSHTEHTRYMNPIQVPEFLAAGKPVIATPVIDVIRSYGNQKLVQIAGTPEEFIRVASLHFTTRDKTEWLQNVADFLSLNSWDSTWQRMMDLMWSRLREKIQQPVVTHGDKIYS